MHRLRGSRSNFRDLQDKVKADPARAERVAELKREAVADHIAEGLTELRAMRAVTQQAVAEQLELSQPNVSRIEHQQDLLLSTLRAYVESLGGRLELSVVFGEGEERVQLEV